MVDPASPPSPTPRPAKSGSGCLWAVIALPIVLVLGLLAGKALGGDSDDGPDEIRAVLDEGDLDGVAWRVEAVRDVEGDRERKSGVSGKSVSVRIDLGCGRVLKKKNNQYNIIVTQ